MIQTLKFKLWKPLLWAYQRVVRGYDDRVTWHLPEYIDDMILANLTYLRHHGLGHPSNITEKKWHKVLDTMIKGFSLEPEWSDKKAWKKYLIARQKALTLLAVYYDDLWD